MQNHFRPRPGLLLMNLGSPKSPHPQDVKDYLRQFLNDPYVIDLPKAFRYLLVNGIILNTRPKNSAEAYEKVWTKEGSPLLVNSFALTEKVKRTIPFPVEVGMRYGSPDLDSGVKKLIDAGANHIILLPLYPQYSYAASETGIVEFERVMNQYKGRIQSTVIEDFFSHPSYIQALSHSLRGALVDFEPDLLLLTYHGIPIRQTNKTRNKKNYQEHCYQTTDFLKAELNLKDDQVMTTFQSRLGPVKWIEPYTDIVLQELPKKGIKKIVVASPSFTADCLETLEEINLRYRQLFLENGGEEFHYVPCLNSAYTFVEAIQEIVHPHIPFAKSL